MESVATPPGYRALRQGRASFTGQIYLVTFTTWHRRRWFADPSRASTAAAALTAESIWRGSSLLAWVLMPDHWHGIVELGNDESLDATIGRVKATSATSVRRAHDWPHRIWADGFHDRALRSDDNVLAAARYLVLNPFRAGLVRRIADYPYWGAVWVDRGGGRSNLVV